MQHHSARVSTGTEHPRCIHAASPSKWVEAFKHRFGHHHPQRRPHHEYNANPRQCTALHRRGATRGHAPSAASSEMSVRTNSSAPGRCRGTRCRHLRQRDAHQHHHHNGLMTTPLPATCAPASLAVGAAVANRAQFRGRPLLPPCPRSLPQARPRPPVHQRDDALWHVRALKHGEVLVPLVRLAAVARLHKGLLARQHLPASATQASATQAARHDPSTCSPLHRRRRRCPRVRVRGRRAAAATAVPAARKRRAAPHHETTPKAKMSAAGEVRCSDTTCEARREARRRGKAQSQQGICGPHIGTLCPLPCLWHAACPSESAANTQGAGLAPREQARARPRPPARAPFPQNKRRGGAPTSGAT